MQKNFLLLSIIAGLIFGFISASFAKKKHRDSLWWFTMGFIFGIFAPLFLALIPPKKKPLPLKQTPEPFSREELKVLWYYLESNQDQQGPMTIKGLMHAFNEGKIKETSYLWNEHMENWQMLSQLPIKDKFTSLPD